MKKKGLLKKVALACTTVALLFSLAACGKEEEETKVTASGDGWFATDEEVEETTEEAIEIDPQENGIAADNLTVAEAPQITLDQTVNFPGDYAGQSISYPSSLQANVQDGFTNGIDFTIAGAQPGSAESHVELLFLFQKLSNYDQYLNQGTATASKALERLLEESEKRIFGDHLINTIDSYLSDNGSNYTVTGNVELNGNIFGESSTDPVRGAMDMRYVGPTGYVLIAITIAPEDQIVNYHDIAQAMLDSSNFTNEWTTSPKEVPQQPAENPNQGSDPGDYGTAYYWYDADGDVWFWNGEYNEFIGFGNDYYIDTDGNYYESNDAGWDFDNDDYWADYDDEVYYEPNDYEEWSDPGDYGDYDEYDYEEEYNDYEPEYNDYEPEYNDYEEWSDPGDYGDW